MFPKATAESYFAGFVADRPHPRMAATGTEGRCELCGLDEAGQMHVVFVSEKARRVLDLRDGEAQTTVQNDESPG